MSKTFQEEWQITYLNSDWLIQFSAQTIRDTRTLPKWRNTFEKLCLWSFVNNQGHYHRRLEVIILLFNDIILDTLHIQITLCLHLTSIWSELPKICDCQNRGKLTHTKMWDRKSTRLNSSHVKRSRMPSSAWKKKKKTHTKHTHNKPTQHNT